MFPLKRFVQGPSLQDEVVSYEEESEKLPVRKGTLTGEEVSKVYEEIINLPSTASSSKYEEPSTSITPSSSSSSKNITIKKEDEEKDPPKLSHLMSLCEANDHVSLEDILEDYPHLVDALDEYGWTLLMSASCAGAVNCVAILLQSGANWYIEDKKGLTALNIAQKNRRDAVSNLLQEWNTCYRERLGRMKNRTDSPGTSTSENNTDDSKRYCEVCQIEYKSLKDEHEKSIAHLVSTAQFGKDKVHFGIPESNKGFQMLVNSGWDKSSGLGPDGQGHKFPVKTVLKRNKLGLGNEKEKKAARITHFGPFDSAAVEGPARVEREVTVRRKEAAKSRSKEKRKEINFRNEFASL